MKPREEKSHKWNRKINICVNINKDNVQETVHTKIGNILKIYQTMKRSNTLQCSWKNQRLLRIRQTNI